MKRVFDFTAALIGIIILSPIFFIFSILVFFQDFKNPFYISDRVGKDGKLFKMFKLRSMVINADKSGLASTSNNDLRITPIGKIIRKFKLDELTQLFNVVLGDMSLVGPRPNVLSDVSLYTNKEKQILTIRPGITDISSIVFSDEGEILSHYDDADKAYQQLIRPGKGALAVFYVNNKSMGLDIALIFLTIYSILSKRAALKVLSNILIQKNINPELVEVVLREKPLIPKPPFGSNKIFETR